MIKFTITFLVVFIIVLIVIIFIAWSAKNTLFKGDIAWSAKKITHRNKNFQASPNKSFKRSNLLKQISRESNEYLREQEKD